MHQPGVEADRQFGAGDDAGELRAGHHPRQDHGAGKAGGEAFGPRLLLGIAPGEDDAPPRRRRAWASSARQCSSGQSLVGQLAACITMA